MAGSVSRRVRATTDAIAEISDVARLVGLTVAALSEAQVALAIGDIPTAELFASVAAIELRTILDGGTACGDLA